MNTCQFCNDEFAPKRYAHLRQHCYKIECEELNRLDRNRKAREKRAAGHRWEGKRKYKDDPKSYRRNRPKSGRKCRHRGAHCLGDTGANYYFCTRCHTELTDQISDPFETYGGRVG